MNTDWAFYRGDIAEGHTPGLDDSDWIPTSLPHIMQLETKHCGGNSIYDGIGWYRRYFKLPASYQDKRIVVSFEGIMTNCDVFLNGEKITDHQGGYMGFVADLTDHIDWDGNNLLAIRVSAEYDPLTPPGKPQDKMDFYYYSGIYRDVRFHWLGRYRNSRMSSIPATSSILSAIISDMPIWNLSLIRQGAKKYGSPSPSICEVLL